MAVTVKTICKACDGTGLYCGFMEPKGTAVVCIRCGGTGCDMLKYMPFVCRKGRRGIKIVSRSQGAAIISGVGATGPCITYAEFAKGKMPRRVEGR